MTLPSQIMVDKIQALPTAKVGLLMGRLEPEHVLALNRALLTVLALP